MAGSLNLCVSDARPAITLRRELAAARARGEDFDDAWERALRRALVGVRTHEREAWRVVLNGHRAVWREAFDGDGEATAWVTMLAAVA